MVTLDGELFVSTGTLDNASSPAELTGGTTVKVTAQTIEEVFEKKLIEINRFITKKNQPKQGGTKTEDTQTVDLLRIRRVLTVKGILADESGDTALTKKNNLITIIRRGGTFTVVWGLTSTGQVRTVNVLKWQCREISGTRYVAGITPAHADLVRGFEVDIQFLVGTDR